MARCHVSTSQLDRRQFLGTSAAAAGSIMVPGTLGAQTAGRGRPVRRAARRASPSWSGSTARSTSRSPSSSSRTGRSRSTRSSSRTSSRRWRSSPPCTRPAIRWTSRSRPCSTWRATSTRASPRPSTGCPAWTSTSRTSRRSREAIAQRDGKTWGLPYFSTVWVFMYNDELLGKAGFKDKPFKSYPELLEQCRKAKKDGVCKYPILWVAGAGFEQLPATWFSMTCNRGGVIFDKQLAPQLGPGSIARETLKWWQNTFKEELADPNSLNLRFIPAVKAFNAGQHVYLGTLAPLLHQPRERSRQLARSPARAAWSGIRATARPSATRCSTSCRARPRTRSGRGSSCSTWAAAPRTVSTRRPIAWPPTPCSAAATSR